MIYPTDQHELQMNRDVAEKSMNTDTHSPRVVVIINPKSGTRSKHGIDDYLSDRLGDKYELDIKYTTAPLDATRYASGAAEEGADMVIVAGGDGTVNEAAAGIVGTETALAIIPLGSGNGLARSLNIPPDLRMATDIIERGHTRICDSGIVNGKQFFCTCGIGFDAVVSEKFSRAGRRGKSTYIQKTITEFVRYTPEHYALSINGDIIVEQAFLIAICNAPQYGNNAYIAPDASLDDGYLNLIVIHSGNILRSALVGVELFTGRLDKNTLIDSFKIKRATISRMGEGPVHLDGDPYSMGKVIDVECVPGSLKIVCPDTIPHFRPFLTPLKSFWLDLGYDMKARLETLFTTK